MKNYNTVYQNTVIRAKCWSRAYFLPVLALIIRQANTVRHILGLTSTRSSGSAYTRAPIFLHIEIAYLAFCNSSCRSGGREERREGGKEREGEVRKSESGTSYHTAPLQTTQ